MKTTVLGCALACGVACGANPSIQPGATMHGFTVKSVTDIPEVDSIKERMVRSGALGACMTGSGSAVFGIFDDADKAEDCAADLRKEYDDVFLTEPVSSGCEIDD